MSKPSGTRLQHLANLGGLVVIAGLDNIDPALLLGALMEIAMRLQQLSSQRLMMLQESGMQRLRERNSEKRAYKTQPSTDNLQVTLTKDDFKLLFNKLGIRLPTLKKDWIPELINTLRG